MKWLSTLQLLRWIDSIGCGRWCTPSSRRSSNHQIQPEIWQHNNWLEINELLHKQTLFQPVPKRRRRREWLTFSWALHCGNYSDIEALLFICVLSLHRCMFTGLRILRCGIFALGKVFFFFFFFKCPNDSEAGEYFHHCAILNVTFSFEFQSTALPISRWIGGHWLSRKEQFSHFYLVWMAIHWIPPLRGNNWRCFNMNWHNRDVQLAFVYWRNTGANFHNEVRRCVTNGTRAQQLNWPSQCRPICNEKPVLYSSQSSL